ncbi:MAG: hypothetical protein NZV14_01630 [Bryobacteraceae bacterium]|nr:hypothetical protein [Bryobacteraceae bacterium]MDW8376830.1 hypothetical protein [Bryobacterales bacterium]
MKRLIPLAFCLPLFAQQTQSTYISDLNGRSVPWGNVTVTKSGNTLTVTELTQSINGRTVPLQSVEERVIREDSAGRVVERIIRRYDATGNPGPLERQIIDEKKNADGSVTSVTSIYRGDLNGRFQLAERTTSEGRKSGSQQTTTTVVERPGINGAFDVAERQTLVVRDDGGKSHSDFTVFRKDSTGRFSEAFRVVTTQEEQDGQRLENIAQYELTDSGKLNLAAQTVVRARKNPDGTESREVDIYRAVPGVVNTTGKPVLYERQLIEQRRQGEKLIETTSVQRPTVSDPKRLGAPQKIAERVCSGTNCK